VIAHPASGSFWSRQVNLTAPSCFTPAPTWRRLIRDRHYQRGMGHHAGPYRRYAWRTRHGRAREERGSRSRRQPQGRHRRSL